MPSSARIERDRARSANQLLRWCALAIAVFALAVILTRTGDDPSSSTESGVTSGGPPPTPDPGWPLFVSADYPAAVARGTTAHITVQCDGPYLSNAFIILWRDDPQYYLPVGNWKLTVEGNSYSYDWAVPSTLATGDYDILLVCAGELEDDDFDPIPFPDGVNSGWQTITVTPGVDEIPPAE